MDLSTRQRLGRRKAALESRLAGLRPVTGERSGPARAAWHAAHALLAAIDEHNREAAGEAAYLSDDQIRRQLRQTWEHNEALIDPIPAPDPEAVLAVRGAPVPWDGVQGWGNHRLVVAAVHDLGGGGAGDTEATAEAWLRWPDAHGWYTAHNYYDAWAEQEAARRGLPRGADLPDALAYAQSIYRTMIRELGYTDLDKAARSADLTGRDGGEYTPEAKERLLALAADQIDAGEVSVSEAAESTGIDAAAIRRYCTEQTRST